MHINKTDKRGIDISVDHFTFIPDVLNEGKVKIIVELVFKTKYLSINKQNFSNKPIYLNKIPSIDDENFHINMNY